VRRIRNVIVVKTLKLFDGEPLGSVRELHVDHADGRPHRDNTPRLGIEIAVRGNAIPYGKIERAELIVDVVLSGAAHETTFCSATEAGERAGERSNLVLKTSQLLRKVNRTKLTGLLEVAEVVELLLREVTRHPRLMRVNHLEGTADVLADIGRVTTARVTEDGRIVVRRLLGATFDRVREEIATVREVHGDLLVDTKSLVTLLEGLGDAVKRGCDFKSPATSDL